MSIKSKNFVATLKIPSANVAIGSIDADVTVIGGGAVGLIQGLSLAQAGISVVLIDRESAEMRPDTPFDGRSYAIAYGSKQILDRLGVWEHVEAVAQPILEIRVADDNAPLFLHYDHREVGQSPFGWIVQSNLLHEALRKSAREHPALTILSPAIAKSVERTVGAARVTLDDRRLIETRLVIAADGKRSALREEAGIKTIEHYYGQDAITTTVTHSLPHNGIAVEHFLPAGPFAILPMSDDPKGGHRSSIVWTERPSVARHVMALEDQGFTAELTRRFGDFLGDVAPTGPRWCHPLSVVYAQRLTDRRLALVGDAAHAIHPIAGQGLNLGIRGAAKLSELIIERRRLGLDPGAPDMLAAYQRQRLFDRLALTVVTDGLNRLFSNDLAPVKLIRDAGLALVGTAPLTPIRKMLMRHAMGTPIFV